MPLVTLEPGRPLEIDPQPPADLYILSNPNQYEGQHTPAPKDQGLVIQYFLSPEGDPGSVDRFNVDIETTVTNNGSYNLALQTVGL